MSHGAASAAGSAAATTGALAAIANATKAFGPVVQVDAENFLTIITLDDTPLVIYAEPRGWFNKSHQYLSSYRGLYFYHKTRSPITLPEGCGVIQADKLSIPDM